ncbi:MAG: hypothetical protein KGI02_06595 [Thaumarchaeota archaeon]|nr:hypothetical protein [Nitrososphaerota archaeon]
MLTWNKRSLDVKSLLNPAFCGEVIRRCIWNYKISSGKSMPYSIVYFILPLVLHNKTNVSMGSYKEIGFFVWLQNNEHLLVDFGARTRRMIPITKEAILFLLKQETLKIDETQNLLIENYELPNKDIVETQNLLMDDHQPVNKNVDGYTDKYFIKAELLGNWFGRAGTPVTIYSALGVSP